LQEALLQSLLVGGLAVLVVISKLRLRPFFEDLECKFNVVSLLKADKNIRLSH